MIGRVLVIAAAGACIACTPASVGPAARSSAAQNRPAATAATTTMRLIFNASFTGTSLNTKRWATCFPWTVDPSKGCTLFGSPREYQWYMPSQVREYNGALHLIARPLATSGLAKSGAQEEYACRSGVVTSYPGLRFKYGKVSIVARVTNGAGTWSAFWLAASNMKWPPEIDIMEHWGSPLSETAVLLHPVGPSSRKGVKTANLAVGWHTFTLNWTSSRLTWYIDGRNVFAVTRYIPRQSMYLIANLAEMSPVTAGSHRCYGSVLIKSVRVWQRS